MSGRWFRFYDEAINDPKVLRMAPEMRWQWVAMLCIASQSNGKIPADEDVSLLLRTPVSQAQEILAEFVSRGLLDRGRDGRLEPHNWRKRQYKSDLSTPRVKQFRKRFKAVAGTPPETETDTEAETDKTNTLSAAPTTSVQQEFALAEEPAQEPAAPHAYPEDFEEVWREYRVVGPKTASKAAAHKAFAKLTAADRKACWSGVVSYAVHVRDERKRRADYPVKHLATFINERGWEPFLEEAA